MEPELREGGPEVFPKVKSCVVAFLEGARSLGFRSTGSGPLSVMVGVGEPHPPAGKRESQKETFWSCGFDSHHPHHTPRPGSVITKHTGVIAGNAGESPARATTHITSVPERVVLGRRSP